MAPSSCAASLTSEELKTKCQPIQAILTSLNVNIMKEKHSSYLISFIPANVLHFGKGLGTFNDKINEIATSTQAACNKYVGQNSQKSSQMNVLIFIAFLLVHNGFLKQCKRQWEQMMHCGTKNLESHLWNRHICVFLKRVCSMFNEQSFKKHVI